MLSIDYFKYIEKFDLALKLVTFILHLLQPVDVIFIHSYSIEFYKNLLISHRFYDMKNSQKRAKLNAMDHMTIAGQKLWWATQMKISILCLN